MMTSRDSSVGSFRRRLHHLGKPRFDAPVIEAVCHLKQIELMLINNNKSDNFYWYAQHTCTKYKKQDTDDKPKTQYQW